MSADLIDYTALHRLWPQSDAYGQPGEWYAYVGRTIEERNSLHHEPSCEPRGVVIRAGWIRRAVNRVAGTVRR